jgi:hypothetical protein
MLAKSDVKFNETHLVLDTPAFYNRLKSVSPALKVTTLNEAGEER